VLFVIVPEEELVRARLAAEAAPHGAMGAIIADPFEADRALIEVAVLFIGLATDAFHPDASLFDAANRRI
jgi:hypothetical protein